MKNDSDHVHVISLLPFFRYAVGPASEQCPAIPFYSKRAAREFFEEAKAALPECGVILYKRRFLSSTITVIEQYTPPPGS